MKKIKKLLSFTLILVGIIGGILTYLLKNETHWIKGQQPFTQTTYPVDIDSGLTGAGIGSGLFSASCLLAGVYLLSNLKDENDVKA